MPERLDILTNARADRVRTVTGLSRRSARFRRRQFLVEGPGAVRELVRFRPEIVRDIYLTEQVAGRETELVERARRHRLYVHLATREVVDTMSSDAQGIVAVATMLPPLDPAAVADPRLVVVLPHASDPGNLGTLIRIADAAGADAVIVCSGSAEVTNPKVVRATTGSLFHLPILSGIDFADAVGHCREEGLAVVAADAGGELDVLAGGTWAARPTAWVFGNEAHGLTDRQRAACDAVASVPIFGRAESLNVAAAAAVCLYASARAQNSPDAD